MPTTSRTCNSHTHKYSTRKSALSRSDYTAIAMPRLPSLARSLCSVHIACKIAAFSRSMMFTALHFDSPSTTLSRCGCCPVARRGRPPSRSMSMTDRSHLGGEDDEGEEDVDDSNVCSESRRNGDGEPTSLCGRYSKMRCLQHHHGPDRPSICEHLSYSMNGRAV